MNEHKGHRQRLKNRFLTQGLRSFDDHNVLELLLFYALPRIDTNKTAHALLNHFGSLDAVLDAPVSELTQVPGIGENTALLLKLTPALGARYLESKNAIGSILATPDAAGRFLLPRFVNLRDETIMLLCLDAKYKAVALRELGKGDVSAAHISIRKVVETALMQNVPNVILAHNHVSGFALPSVEDISSTHMLQEALSLVGVNLLDHIIISGDDFVSLRDNGDMEKSRKTESEMQE